MENNQELFFELTEFEAESIEGGETSSFYYIPKGIAKKFGVSEGEYFDPTVNQTEEGYDYYEYRPNANWVQVNASLPE